MPDLEIVTALPKLPPRPRDGHKGTFGRVLVVAGSRGMSGAAILTGSGALRGGAGLVQVVCPREVQPVVAAGNPCYLTAGLACDSDGHFAGAAEDQLIALAERADVLAVGPGLGVTEGTIWLVRNLLERGGRPTVLDADGLNVLAPLEPGELRGRADPLILTPHPGELARLLGTSAAELLADREARAVAFAADQGVVLVLKGHQTLVTDGRRLYRNETGNPGMGTGGTGDVLTGLIAALLGQGLDPFAAAQLGVFLHGRAGDLAAAELGEVSLTAADLPDYLPYAFRDRPA
ncbi:MAG TPA: NAD(P)H-hydrate dehydratase [Gemmataceae bacterium]